MIARSAAARAAASVVLAGTLLLGTAGCTFISTQATLIHYDPSDGVSATVGDVDLRNVVAIINEDGTAINLVATLVNSGSSTAKVGFQTESGGQKVTESMHVSGNASESFGGTPDQEQILILNPDVEAGDLLPVYVQYSDHPGEQLLVPVLEATGDYAELAPEGPAAKPES